jgi:hypothetical protein
MNYDPILDYAIISVMVIAVSIGSSYRSILEEMRRWKLNLAAFQIFKALDQPYGHNFFVANSAATGSADISYSNNFCQYDPNMFK